MTTKKFYYLGFDIVAVKDATGILVKSPKWTHYSPVTVMPRATNAFWSDYYGYAILRESRKALEDK